MNAQTDRIRYTVMPNKLYDYNEEEVYKIPNKDVRRKTVVLSELIISFWYYIISLISLLQIKGAHRPAHESGLSKV